MGFLIIFSILFVLILLFSSKTLSPIPYFPTQKVDLPLIIRSLSLRNNQTIFDLGAGDGIVIFEAAKEAYKKNLNTKFVAVEINPVLILILHLRRFFHKNKKNINVVYGDIFKFNFTNFKNFITIYLYISPWYFEKTLKNIQRQTPKFKLVSYMYPVKTASTPLNGTTAIEAKNSIFIYDF